MAPEVKTLFVVCLTVAFGLAACSGDDTSALKTQVAALQTQVSQPTATPPATPTPEPDRVVGVIAQCDEIGTNRPILGEECTFWFQNAKGLPQLVINSRNNRYAITVRSSSGTIYTVMVPTTFYYNADGSSARWDPKSPNLGDPWPPK